MTVRVDDGPRDGQSRSGYVEEQAALTAVALGCGRRIDDVQSQCDPSTSRITSDRGEKNLFPAVLLFSFFLFISFFRTGGKGNGSHSLPEIVDGHL